jgi:glucose-1-phosphate adenylyltransferase
MGVYIFNWQTLKAYLEQDENNPDSSNDFGKDIIPTMLREGVQVYAYPFDGYWKDVGTVRSLWEANMDLLNEDNKLNLFDRQWRIYSLSPYQPPHYIAATAHVTRSMLNEGCSVYGRVDHSVLFYGVHVGAESIVRDSVIMPNVKIGAGAQIHRAIIGEGTVIEEGCIIGDPNGVDSGEITLIGDHQSIRKEVSA